jgi:hypothetical protein
MQNAAAPAPRERCADCASSYASNVRIAGIVLCGRCLEEARKLSDDLRVKDWKANHQPAARPGSPRQQREPGDDG